MSFGQYLVNFAQLLNGGLPVENDESSYRLAVAGYQCRKTYDDMLKCFRNREDGDNHCKDRQLAVDSCVDESLSKDVTNCRDEFQDLVRCLRLQKDDPAFCNALGRKVLACKDL